MAARSPLLLSLVPILAVLSGAAGCGYEMVQYGSGRSSDDVEPGAPAVSVETLLNQTNEPGVELIVSEAMRREFLRRGGVRLVNDPAEADLLVRGRVAAVETFSRSLSTVVLTLEYQLTIVLELAVQTRDGERIPVDPAALRATDLYLASADVEAARKNRREVLRRVSGVLARRLHDSLDISVLRP